MLCETNLIFPFGIRFHIHPCSFIPLQDQIQIIDFGKNEKPNFSDNDSLKFGRRRQRVKFSQDNFLVIILRTDSQRYGFWAADSGGTARNDL